MLYIREEKDGLAFRVFILPKSSKNVVSGLYEDSIKIKITAPPIDGAANKLCVKFLAKCLKVSKSSIEIMSGKTGRKKLILLRYPNDKRTPQDKKKLYEKILSLIEKKTQSIP